jgi:hypothetical protein
MGDPQRPLPWSVVWHPAPGHRSRHRVASWRESAEARWKQSVVIRSQWRCYLRHALRPGGRRAAVRRPDSWRHGPQSSTAVRLPGTAMAAIVAPAPERRAQRRRTIEPGQSSLAVRLRTGPSLRVIDMSPEGLLVETPVRLLPGHAVNLVLHTGADQVSVRGLVVHSRVGTIRGGAELRYRVGLWLAAGTNCSDVGTTLAAGERTTRVERSQWPRETSAVR